jgi:hypothetical protein
MHTKEAASRRKEKAYHLQARQDQEDVQPRHWNCESRKSSVWCAAAVHTRRPGVQRLRREVLHYGPTFGCSDAFPLSSVR